MNRACNEMQGNRAGEGVPEIVRVQVACEDRLGTLPAVFGRLALEFELSVYGWMDLLCEGYTGGYWEFYRLSNAGFYMAPARGRFRMFCPGNGFEGELSADAAGLVACLYALNGLACKHGRGRWVTV
jgi:hypothetical protein